MKKKTKRARSRPSTFRMKLDATPEEVADRMFANAKRPDPSIRLPKKRTGTPRGVP